MILRSILKWSWIKERSSVSCPSISVTGIRFIPYILRCFNYPTLVDAVIVLNLYKKQVFLKRRFNEIFFDTGISPSELEMTLREFKRLLYYQIPINAIGAGHNNQLLTVNDVVALSGLPHHIIYANAKSGNIPSFRTGKKYKFNSSRR